MDISYFVCVPRWIESNHPVTPLCVRRCYFVQDIPPMYDKRLQRLWWCPYRGGGGRQPFLPAHAPRHTRLVWRGVILRGEAERGL